MIVLNNQVKLRLTPDRNGVTKDITGETLVNSLEVHRDNTLSDNIGYSFTLSADGNNTALPTSSLPSVPIYIDGSSKVDGQLDGGLIVAGGATIGTASLDLNVIGGSNANVIPVLSTGYNEILSPDNDIVYAILSTNQSDGAIPIDNGIQITFATVNSVGQYVVYELESGSYYLEPNTIYSFGHARVANLTPNGRNTSSAGATSLDELKDLISSNAPLTWVTPTLLNGWENYDYDFVPARYSIKDDFVYIDGTIKNGTIDSPIFTLPVEGRPTNTIVVPVVSGIGTGRLQVYSNGDVKLVDGDNTFTSLHSTIYL